MSGNLGLNMKPGINYCAPVGEIGFRGASKGLARLIPLAPKGKRSEQILFFFGVDVPADKLPYLPDMGVDSSFRKKGYWHHYKIKNGIFIVHLTPNNEELSSFTKQDVLQAVLFEGEKEPRIFLDRRRELIRKGVLSSEDLQKIQDLLIQKQIVLN